MDYNLKKPCECCPFRRGTPMRLTPARVGEVVGMMLNPNGGEFPCHHFVKHDDDGEGGWSEKKGAQHCAGALIFAEKNETATQMMRVCERIGMYDAAALMANQEVVDSVFSDYGEAFKHLTSPQENELNKSVDNGGGSKRSSSDDGRKRKANSGRAQRGRRKVASHAVPGG